MMEIKHTVEILTKDIQDIEKLVRNLNNSPIPPKIELDLALSKLRHVYELLSMIREDAAEQTTKPGLKAEPLAEQPVAEQVITETSIADKIEPGSPVYKHAEEQAVEKPVEDPVYQEPVQTENPVVEVEPKPEPVQQEIPIQAEIELEKTPPARKKEAEILAEKFTNDPSINENIASNVKQSDLTSKISGQPIDNIGRNIGINDRFLIIRELFDGDNESYNHLISQLDSSSGSDEALGILEAKFPEQRDHDGYILLTQLTMRKFISG